MIVKLKKHNSDDQLNYGSHGFADTREFLKEGKEYEAVIDEHSWHTYVCINGKGFNVVCFEQLGDDIGDEVNRPDGLPKKLEAIIVDTPNVFMLRIGTVPRTTDRGLANIIPMGISRDDKDAAIAFIKRLVNCYNRAI